MLEHTAHEAQRLGLGVDMATGTGWPFGGPGVRSEDSNTGIALVGGRLAGAPTKMMVKRAAPGGKGWCSIRIRRRPSRAISHRSRRIRTLAPGTRSRAVSRPFEYYGAGWTPALPDLFARMHAVVALIAKDAEITAFAWEPFDAERLFVATGPRSCLEFPSKRTTPSSTPLRVIAASSTAGEAANRCLSRTWSRSSWRILLPSKMLLVHLFFDRYTPRTRNVGSSSEK